jgi:hypothetical protein
MLTLVALFFFVLTQFVYDYTAIGDSTNWSIFYFSTTYLSFTLIAFDLIFKESSKAIRYTALSMGLYFIFLIFLEITLINVPFDEYMQKVNDTHIAIGAGIVLCFLLIFISIKAWERRLLKRL